MNDSHFNLADHDPLAKGLRRLPPRWQVAIGLAVIVGMPIWLVLAIVLSGSRDSVAIPAAYTTMVLWIVGKAILRKYRPSR